MFSGAGCATLASEVVADQAGVANVPAMAAANQTSTFSARALDAAGNASACTDLAYLHDDIPPTLTLTLANDGTETLVVTVQAGAGGGSAITEQKACVSHDIRVCEAGFAYAASTPGVAPQSAARLEHGSKRAAAASRPSTG